MNKTQRLASNVEYLYAQKQEVHDEVDAIIDRYWVRWKLKNRQIIKNRISGDKREEVGRVAPSLRVHKSGIKVSYIRWRLYDKPYNQIHIKGKEAQRYAKEFPRDANGITKLEVILQKAEEWEKALIIETQAKLIPLAREMNGLHEAIKKINVAIRAIEKLNNQGGHHG